MLGYSGAGKWSVETSEIGLVIRYPKGKPSMVCCRREWNRCIGQNRVENGLWAPRNQKTGHSNIVNKPNGLHAFEADHNIVGFSIVARTQAVAWVEARSGTAVTVCDSSVECIE